MRSFLFLSGLAAAACVAWPVHASGRPLLVVHRTEDTSDCPDARALAALVADQMKRPALDAAFDMPPGGDHGLDVQIYRSDQGFTAVIQAGGKTRQLSDKGTTCGGLAGALAVSIAVLLDTEPLPPAPEPAAPVEPPGPPGPPVFPAAPLAPASFQSLPPEPLGLPAHEGDADPLPSRYRLSVAAAPALTVGLLQGFAGGVTGEVELRIGRFTVAAGVLALPGQSFSYSGGQVNLDLTAGMIRACAILAGDEPLRFVLCLDPMAGTMRGGGQGFSVDQSATLPWVSVATSALFQQKIWGRLSWGARSELVVPLLKDSLMVNNVGTAFTAAPVGGVWDVELRVSIW